MSLKILLVGQPNVGKSSLMNALIGPRIVVSNYPGTTVEMTRGERKVGRTRLVLFDTPGIYSISDRSEEEKVTEQALFEESPDAVIVVADATALERSLYLALQIIEAGLPMIIALNFHEEAEKKGILIDDEKLNRILGVPVIRINPLKRRGVRELFDTIMKLKPGGINFTVRYDDHIEEAIKYIASQIRDSSLPKRFIALRILEGDSDFYRYLEDKSSLEEMKRIILNAHPLVSEDISVTRYGTAAFIARTVTNLVPLPRPSQRLESYADGLLLHSISGPVTSVLFFVSLFGVLLWLGSLIQGILMDMTAWFLSGIHVGSGLLGLALQSGATGLAAGVSIALPYVFLFYLLLGLVEDIGILSRFVVNLDAFSRKFKLPGKALIPLTLGLGCTVPAIRSTRILSSQRERLLAASFFTSIPCSSRMAIIMGVVGYFGGALLAISVLVAMFISLLIWGFIAKRISKVATAPLLVELPPYRRPLLSNIIAKSWIRMKDFVYVVMPLLVAGGIIYALFDWSGASRDIVGPLSPIASWLRLPAVMIIPLVFGFVQKDLTGPMLLTVLGGSTAVYSLTQIQLFTFGVAATVGIPCMIAFGMLAHEMGSKKATILTLISISYGLLFAGLASRVASLIA